MTSKADEARAVVDAFGKRSPDALQLARAVSLAARVEPELLRKVRLELLPDIDAGAEADLWFSPLVQSSTPLAFTFLPAIADQLRRDLAESRDSLTRAWLVLSAVHEHSPVAMKLEERVTWTIINGGPTAHDEIEKDLNSVTSAILTQNRTGLARWALRAVPRLPVEARQTKAAQTLLVTAAAHLGAWQMLQKQVENNNLPATFINDLKVVLPSNLPQVEVGVRLLDDLDGFGLPVPATLRRYVVEFSNPPLSDQSDLVRVPGTVPMLLEVSWNGNEERQVKQLSLYRGRVETINVGGTPVTIRTARGDFYTLSENEEKEPSIVDRHAAVLARLPLQPKIGFVTRSSGSASNLVESMRSRLVPGTTGVFQLSGQGGIGKTVVASELARRLVQRYPQRIVWLSAATQANLDLNNILNGIATQLGRSDLRRLNPKAKVIEIKSLLGLQPTLIFIDDFDGVQTKEKKRCFDFLKLCPSAVLLIHKVYNIHVPERNSFVLRAMSQAESFEFLERTIDQTASPENFTGVNLAELAAVCRGNPLAMQLLVAQFQFTNSPDDLIKINGSLTAIFERSFELISRDARACSFALALFVPSASKAALSEVAGFGADLERTEKAAGQLITLQLAHSPGNDERLTINAFVRLNLRKRLRRIHYRQRFINYFVDYAEQHAEATVAHYDALEAELENLLGAIDLASSRSWNEVIRLSLALNRFLDVRGYWDEALRRNSQAQYAARMLGEDDVLPQLHQAAGEIYLRRGEFAKAEKAFRSVLTHYGDTVNTDVADATRRLGSIALERENLMKAKRLYSQSLEISRQLKLDASIADNLHNLAIVAQLEGKPDEAMKLYEESLRLSERVGDQRGAAVSLHQLGVVSREQGNYEQARNYFERSLSIKRSLGYREGMADTLHQLGLLYRTLGEKQQAAQPFAQALTLYQELQSPAAAVAASDLATLTTPARAKVTSKRMPSRKRKTKVAKSPAKKTAAKKGAAKKRRIGGISSLFSSRRRKSGGRMGGRFGPRSRKSFR